MDQSPDSGQEASALVVRPDSESLGEFSSISEALLVAKDGAVLDVYPGVYVENIRLYQNNVTVRKAGFLNESVTIRPLSVHKPVLFCSGVRCIFKGINFEGCQNSSSLLNSVEANSSVLALALIMIHNGHATFTGCKFAMSRGTGIVSFGSKANMELSDCDVDGKTSGNIGLLFEKSKGSIQNTRINGFRIGLRAFNQSELRITATTISDTLAYGCVFLDVNETNINSLKIIKNSGIGLHGDNSTLSISNSMLEQNKEGGMTIFNCPRFSLKNTTVKQNGQDGVIIEGCLNFNISQNTISENSVAGLWIRNSITGLISSVVLKKNGKDGVVIQSSTGIRLLNNTIERSGSNGIFLFENSIARVAENELSNNASYPVAINTGSSATISNNRIKTDQNNNLVAKAFHASDQPNIVADNNVIILPHGSVNKAIVGFDANKSSEVHGQNIVSTPRKESFTSPHSPKSPRQINSPRKLSTDKPRPSLRRANTPPPPKKSDKTNPEQDKDIDGDDSHTPQIFSFRIRCKPTPNLVSCLKSKKNKARNSKSVQFSREMEFKSVDNEISRTEDPEWSQYERQAQLSTERERLSHEFPMDMYKEPSIELPPPTPRFSFVNPNNEDETYSSRIGDPVDEQHVPVMVLDNIPGSQQTSSGPHQLRPTPGKALDSTPGMFSPPVRSRFADERKSELHAEGQTQANQSDTGGDISALDIPRKSDSQALAGNNESSELSATLHGLESPVIAPSWRRTLSGQFTSVAEMPRGSFSFESQSTLTRIQSAPVMPTITAQPAKPPPESIRTVASIGKSSSNIFFTSDVADKKEPRSSIDQTAPNTETRQPSEKAKEDEPEPRQRSISRRIMGSFGLLPWERSQEGQKAPSEREEDSAAGPARNRRAGAIGLSDSRMNMLQPLGLGSEADSDVSVPTTASDNSGSK